MTNERKVNSILPNEVITSKIYLIRGEKIMLDRDLANLFDVKAIRLREQVKRNIEKFPIHFIFQLTIEEVTTMVSQNAIPSRQHLGGNLPYAYTEHGVLQWAKVLRNDRATQMSNKIIEIFIKMRETLSTHKKYLKDLNILEQFEKVKKKELEYKNRPKIGYKISSYCQKVTYYK